MAGVAALPLTASADSAPAAPAGSATASTLTLQISLAPVTAALKTSGQDVAGTAFGALASAYSKLQGALCPINTGAPAPVPSAPAVPLACSLRLPDSLPSSLTVHVGQAESKAIFNTTATDVVGGASDSTPVNTDWTVLNTNLGVLQTALTSLIQGGTQALTQGGASALTSFLTSSGPGQLTINGQPLGTAEFNILGTVAASLNQPNAADTPWQTANAVQVTVNQNATKTPVDGAKVNVDPFNAYALNAATTATDGTKGPQVSAANTTVGAGLPAFVVSGINAAGLQGLSAELHSLIDALSKAIADPSNAGNILNNVPNVPPALQGTLSTLGGLVNKAVSDVTGTVSGATGAAPVSVPVDVNALKVWTAKLSATLDGLNAVITAAASLPDVSNLVHATESIATTSTAPVAGGGVTALATSSLGSLDVLPIGSQLAGLLSALPNVTPTTALLSIGGIDSASTATVAPGNADAPSGTSAFKSLSILGQNIDVAYALGVKPGTETVKSFRFPGLGANLGDGWLTLDITRGLQQTSINSATEKAVSMAALSIKLINGCGVNACSDAVAGVISGLTGTNAAAPRTASTGNGSNGIEALGADGPLLGAAVSDTAVHVATDVPVPSDCTTNPSLCPVSHLFVGGNNPPTPPVTPTTSITSLPKTGMLGSFAIPAGLLLIAVAISLRVAPGLRTRLRRVR